MVALVTSRYSLVAVGYVAGDYVAIGYVALWPYASGLPSVEERH